MQDQRAYLKKVQALCEFSFKPDPTGIDLEHIFQEMEEEKIDVIWEDSDVKVYQELVHLSLRALATRIYRPDINIEIKAPERDHQLVNDDGKLRLITRFTSSPEDLVPVKFSEPKLKNDRGQKDIYEVHLPFLVYRAIELLTHLPPHTLRLCKANDCNNSFATTHKTKSYCSPRCRNRMGVYAARSKHKGTK